MDETKDSAPTPTPVMDIQPPKPATAPTEAAPTETEPAATDPTAPQTPTQIAVSTPAEGPSLGESSSDDTPASNTAAPAPVSNAPKRHVPVGVIVTAIVVALLLVGLTVLAFMKSKDNMADHDMSSANPKASSKVTGAEVSKTSDGLDQDINSVNDDTDFVDTELSDSSLGLQ